MNKILSEVKLLIILLMISDPSLVFGQWSMPVNISPTAISALLNESMGPCIGVSNDTLHVVWADRLSSTKGAIYYTQSVDTGLTWKTPIAISDTSGNAWNPAIAINGRCIHVAWRGIDSLNNAHRTSYYKHSLDGGLTWGPLVIIDDNIADWPAITVSGTIVYVVNDINVSSTPYNTEIFFLKSTDNGTTWSTHQQITFSEGRSEDEAIIAQGPNLYMSWNDNRNGYMQIFYKQSADFGATWGPDLLINNEHSYGTAIFADDNKIDISSAGALTGHYQIHLNQSADNGSTWNTDRDLTHDTANTYYYPYLVRDSLDLHLTCLKVGTGAEYLHSTDGGASWYPPFTFFYGNPGITAFPAITGCSLHIIYCNNTDHKIYYLRNPNGNPGHCSEAIAGVKSGYQKNQISVFPNPFTSETTIRISYTEIIDNAEFRVYDVFGNEVQKITGINSNEIIFKRGQLNDGIYFYKVFQNEKIRITGKLIIE